MTIYIAGPNGKPLAFESEAEVEAYRRAQREAQPPLLLCLRKHRSEDLRLREQMRQTLTERGRLRTLGFEAIERDLSDLNHAMVEDIKTAEREVESPSSKIAVALSIHD